jgi:hypothetical protein
MDQFYVVLPSDSSAYCFPRNTVPNFRKKLAAPIELEPNKWEVGLVEISYPKGYKKQPLHNILRINSMEIKFLVRYYTSLHDIFVTLMKHFKTADEKQEFVYKFHAYLNKYVSSDGYVTELLGVCYGENSLQIGEKLVSHFPVQVYNGLKDFAKKIMTPANCRSSRIPGVETDNSKFTAPEAIFVYMDITKPNLVRDSHVRPLTRLHFQSSSGHYRFCYPLYRPVEQTYKESMGIRLVTKSGEDVAFDDSDIPCLVILHFKKKPSE